MFADLARAHGVEFVPLPGDPSEALITTAAVEMGNNPVRFVRWLKQNFRPVLRDLFRLTLETATGSDLVLGSSLSLAAFPVAERLGIPAISFQLQPTTVTRAFAGATVAPPPAWLPFKGAYNVVATKLANQTVLQLLRPLTDECRKDLLDLPPLGIRRWWNVDSPRDPTPIVYAYSAAVVPRPSDWGPFKQVSGYWFLDAAVAYEPPQALASFLDRGPPPVYVGTGSMVDHAAEEMNHIVREAIGQTGQRAILHRGWSGLGAGDLPDSILVVDDVPHDWLFPRCAAVVHHGGAGTTAAGLRAGVAPCRAPHGRRAVLSRSVLLGLASARAGRGPARDSPQAAHRRASVGSRPARGRGRHDAGAGRRDRGAHSRRGRRGEGHLTDRGLRTRGYR